MNRELDRVNSVKQHVQRSLCWTGSNAVYPPSAGHRHRAVTVVPAELVPGSVPSAVCRSQGRSFISFSTSSSRSYSNLRYPCFAIELYIANLRNQFSIPGHREMTASSPRTFSIPRHDNSTNAENRTSSNAFSTWMKWSLDCANTSCHWVLISCNIGQRSR